MLAPSILPEEFAVWIKIHGAPFGHHRHKYHFLRHFYSEETLQKFRGPFAIQSNSTTRTYEYPWAYYVAKRANKKKNCRNWGQPSGLQFVLSSEGHEVVNVDPGMSATGLGWPSDERSVRKLGSMVQY